MQYPRISILIPTLNAASVLEECLKSISLQDYPKDLIEIIVADGGSSDNTREIAGKYQATIVENPLKTAESGKVVALKKASGEFIALIDSDNILPDGAWIRQMIGPLLAHDEALGSEPLSYTWRATDGFITRYCALIGMNDPLVMFLGNYDRMNLITGKWTETPHEEKDCGAYLMVKFGKDGIPTIGANGVVFRAGFLKQFQDVDYLFDIDILSHELRSKGVVNFIKTKNGIVHTFCENDVGKFARKQKRRIVDYLYFRKSKSTREFNWDYFNIGGSSSWGLIKFVIYCVTLVPLILQAIKGFIKKRDTAWLFHPLACEITFFVYAWHKIFSFLYKEQMSRKNWKQ